MEEEDFFSNLFHMSFFHDSGVGGEVREDLPSIEHKFFLFLSEVFYVEDVVIKVLRIGHSVSLFHFGYSHIVSYFLGGFFGCIGVGDLELGTDTAAVFEFLDLDDFAANCWLVRFYLHKFIFATNLLQAKINNNNISFFYPHFEFIIVTFLHVQKIFH